MARPLRPQNPFAERLIQARGEMSRVEVTQKLGVNIETLGGYERGKNAPPYSFLADIKDLYGVSLDWLITGKGEMRPSQAPVADPAPTAPAAAPTGPILDMGLLQTTLGAFAQAARTDPAILKMSPEDLAAFFMQGYEWLGSASRSEKAKMAAAYRSRTDREAG